MIDGKVVVYVAGPYTSGDVAVNVRNAIEAGDKLFQAGLLPHIPHLTHFWHLIFPHDTEFWYQYDLHWLKIADVLLRLPGESSGADNELTQFRKRFNPDNLSLKVFSNTDVLLELMAHVVDEVTHGH
jgi:hypothetical protein